MNNYSDHLQILSAQAHPEGGWGYSPGQPPQLEPTCLALMALSLAPATHQNQIDKGRRFLGQCRGADGAYRAAAGRNEAVWPTSLALFTQQLLDGSAANGRLSVDNLLALTGKVPPNTEAGELHDIDLKLVGWPWGEGNFSWVEPTAWAIIALRAAGQGSHPRVQEGSKLLLDRAMDEGGINYGNRLVLGRRTEPIPVPTALMLLALQGVNHPRIKSATDYLLTQIDSHDIEHLCWSKIALDVHVRAGCVSDGGVLARFDERIQAACHGRANITWTKSAPVRQALCALALSTGERNVFRLSDELARPGDGTAVADSVLGTQYSVLGTEYSATSGPQALAPRPSPLASRFGSWFRGLAVKAVGQLRQPPVQSAVHITRAPDYNADLAALLQDQYQHFKATVPLTGKRVVLKPNLVEWHPDKVINTDPRVVSAVIELCKREGAAEIIVAEGPGHWRNVEYLVRQSGLGDVLTRHNVPFIDLNHDEPVKTPNLGRLTGLDYLYLSRTVATAEVLVSLPKLKTHHWAGATLSLKNLFGTLPGTCYGWPKNELHWRGIDNSIVDIALTRTPELAIVDGIVGMEGDGPLNGTAKPFGALIMGADLVAVDSSCCRLMELDPEQIGYLVMGNAKKLGRMKEKEIPQLGESIASLAQPFATVPHMEKICKRRSA